jgi:fibronectin type 3 domain-containing protein
MKNKVLYIIILALLMSGKLFSQSISRAEYFFDNDPGVGLGTLVPSLTPGDSIEKNFNFDISSLNSGYHRLLLRTRDTKGRWSLVMSRKFYIYDPTFIDLTSPSPDILGFEYFFDVDAGVGSGTWINTTTIGDSAVETIDFSTAGLSEGYHKLIIRAKDADGKWGLVRLFKFYIYSDIYKSLVKKSPKILAAEYFFDKDTVPPGEGNTLNVGEGNEVEWTGQISVAGLDVGEHVLFIRVKDSTGIWSQSYPKLFNVVDLVSGTNSPICAGSSDGEATITMNGGIPPFTYLWNDPLQQTTQTATGLQAGAYTVTVTDQAGAVVKESVKITEFDTIQIDITTSDTECNEANGSATASATGDNPPYDYLWTSGSEEESATDLRSGIYLVTVTDNAGCSNTEVATINDIGGPVISVNAIQNLKCAGDANGIIDINVTGGTPPYDYSWSNGETSQDVMNLKAGNYEIVVKDANGCMAAKSIRIQQPAPITFSMDVTPADCGINNGTATVMVTGGTVPYAYHWDGLTPPYNATRNNLAAGVYTVTVEDKNNCSSSIKVPISETGAPTVNVTSVSQSSCGMQDGKILISVAGGTGSYTYDWKKDGVTVNTLKDLTGAAPGDYNVAVSDGSGCKSYAAATIPAKLPPTPQICLVTVDSVKGKNQIAWNKVNGAGIVSYNIYRETTSSEVFDLIATRPYDSLSLFTDVFADPRNRSWRYKISAVDGCGVESRLSPPHKTMHLTINLGILNSVNLIWNHYEGFVPLNNSYNIWRYSGGKSEILTTVPNNDNSYTDLTPPDGQVYYVVEAVHPTGCTPSLKAETLNSSRSNRQNKLKTGITDEYNDLYNVNIYPNPGNGLFNVTFDFPVKKEVEIKIFDLTGKIVYVNKISGEKTNPNFQIDISSYAQGIYQLNLKTDRKIFNMPLIIE